MSLGTGSEFLDCLAIGQQAKNSKMIAVFPGLELPNNKGRHFSALIWLAIRKKGLSAIHVG